MLALRRFPRHVCCRLSTALQCLNLRRFPFFAARQTYRRRLLVSLALLGCLLIAVQFALAQPEARGTGVTPAQVQAAYLFNFAKYVEWPEGTFLSSDAPIYIGVLGRDPFGPLLERTIADRTIGSRRVLVKRSNNGRELKGCHILFISSSERERLPAVFQQVRGSWALTVSEMPRFLERGMVAFVTDRGVVRFDINLDNVKRAGLNLSARMLASAREVRKPSGPQP